MSSFIGGGGSGPAGPTGAAGIQWTLLNDITLNGGETGFGINGYGTAEEIYMQVADLTTNDGAFDTLFLFSIDNGDNYSAPVVVTAFHVPDLPDAQNAFIWITGLKAGVLAAIGGTAPANLETPQLITPVAGFGFIGGAPVDYIQWNASAFAYGAGGNIKMWYR